MKLFGLSRVSAPFALGMALLVGSIAQAEVQRIEVSSGEVRAPLVELYTSEGCSSCPPADDWLRRLGLILDEDFAAVPLAFHVDYWNYLGWTDPFSKPAFTTRQREAPANFRRGSIYTPEFIADGREARGGDAVLRAIKKANAQIAATSIRLQVARADGVATFLETEIRVDNQATAKHAQAYLAIYENAITREIGGGENHGRTLKHDFVVRHWSRPRNIRQGENQFKVKVKIHQDWAHGNLGLAVIVVNSESGETLQAVRTPLADLFSG